MIELLIVKPAHDHFSFFCPMVESHEGPDSERGFTKSKWSGLMFFFVCIHNVSQNYFYKGSNDFMFHLRLHRTILPKTIKQSVGHFALLNHCRFQSSASSIVSSLFTLIFHRPDHLVQKQGCIRSDKDVIQYDFSFEDRQLLIRPNFHRTFAISFLFLEYFLTQKRRNDVVYPFIN